MCSLRMFSTSVLPSLKWFSPVIYRGPWERIVSELCALSFIRISADFTFSVRNLTIMRCATTEQTTWSLFVITTDKKQADVQWCVITVIGIPSLTTSRVILFYAGIFMLEKEVHLNAATKFYSLPYIINYDQMEDNKNETRQNAFSCPSLGLSSHFFPRVIRRKLSVTSFNIDQML